MITFNNIITALENFANNHFFIKSFSHGNIEEIDMDKYSRYPLMHVVYAGSDYEEGTKTYRFEIYIVDLPSDKIDKISYQREVISDSEQCAEDLLADLTTGGNIFSFYTYELTSATITPLEEETKNVLSGVVLDISIQIPYQYDSCNAPLTGITPSESCDPVQVNVNGNAYATPTSGSTLNVLVEYENGTPVGTIVGNVVEIPNPASCDPADVENSDLTYSTTVASGGTLVLPDITLTLPDSTTTTYPSVKNLDIRTYRSGIEYHRPYYSQKTSYINGDEGWQMQQGTYAYTRPAYTLRHARLDYSVGASSVFYTLDNDNAFGNRFRFTDTLGNQVASGTGVAFIDHLTGLMWYGTQQGQATWTNAFSVVTSANGAVIGGYSDWRLPAIGELYTAFNYEGSTASLPLHLKTSHRSLFGHRQRILPLLLRQ